MLQAVCVHGRHFNSRQPSGLTKLNLVYFDCEMSLLQEMTGDCEVFVYHGRLTRDDRPGECGALCGERELERVFIGSMVVMYILHVCNVHMHNAQ